MSRAGTVARTYAVGGRIFARAIPVFPVGPHKRPLVERGFYAATADLEQIARWWRRWSEAGIGLPTGPRTGVVVLDLDGPEAAAWYRQRLEQAGQRRPITPIARTPRGGWHVFFAAPSTGRVRCSAGKLGPGIDVRGEGGYVVVWPSRAAGGRWRWWRDHEPWRVGLAPCPAWMLEPEPGWQERYGSAAPSPGDGRAYAMAALAEEGAEVVKTPPGGRNHRLNLAAFNIGQLVGAGMLDEGYAAGWLVAAGRWAGLSDVESSRTVRSGLAAGVRNPRGAP